MKIMKVAINANKLCYSLFQILMSVASTLMAVLTNAPTPLDPTHAAVGQGTVWQPTDAHVKVRYIKFSSTE